MKNTFIHFEEASAAVRSCRRAASVPPCFGDAARRGEAASVPPVLGSGAQAVRPTSVLVVSPQEGAAQGDLWRTPSLAV